MPELRPDLSRLYNDLATRFHSGLHNIGCSLRQQITTRFGNSNSNDDSINNDDSTLNQNQSSSSSNNTTDSSENSPINQRNNSTNSSHRSNRRSSRHHHHHHHRHHHHSHSSSCRDREYHRQAYHPYLFGGSNINNNQNVSIIHRNGGLITVRSIDHNNNQTKDRNILAAILSIIVIAILATALVQPKWFSIYNDLCVPQRYFTTKSDISIDKDENPFFSSSSIFDFQQSLNQYTQYRPQYFYNNNGGPFHSSTYSLTPVTIYGLTPDFKICANQQILALKRTIIGLCFLAIMTTLVQFFMDTMGTNSGNGNGNGRHKWMQSMRHYSIGNIVCVLICILIIGLCYFISVLYERVQLEQLFNTKSSQQSQQHQPNAFWIKSRIISRATFTMTGGNANVGQPVDYLTIHQIEVKFELSYYLVTLAGFLSILASAANLFRRPRQIFIERISGYGNNDCTNDYYHRSSLIRHLRTSSNINHNNNQNNGDENSLLNSDVLLNNSLEPSSSSPPTTSFTNDFITNNWSIYCRNNNSNNFQHNRLNGHSSAILIPPPPPPPITHQSSCPPPPPYSP